MRFDHKKKSGRYSLRCIKGEDMDFNNREFAKLRKDMKAALAGLEEKYHLNFEFGNITYGEYDFKVKVSAKKTDIENIRKIDFERKCRKYGFSPEDYERKVEFNGSKYLFIGFRDNAKKYCCWVEKIGDKTTAAVDTLSMREALNRAC